MLRCHPQSIKSLIAAVEAGKKYPETGDAQDTQANSMCKVRVAARVDDTQSGS